MKVSTRGLAEIAGHEGIVTSRYKDSVGVWTLGIGHTAAAGPPDPKTNIREYSIPEIMDIFARDIGKFEARVRKAFTRELTQAQFDAAVSFDFNTGGIHKASWVTHFNAGNDAAAKKAFMNWSKPEEIIPRRKAERDLFFGGGYGNGVANIYPATASGKVMWRSGKRVNVFDLLGTPEPSKPEPKPTEKPTSAPKPVPAPVTPAKQSSGVLGAFLAFLASILKGK